MISVSLDQEVELALQQSSIVGSSAPIKALIEKEPLTDRFSLLLRMMLHEPDDATMRARIAGLLNDKQPNGSVRQEHLYLMTQACLFLDAHPLNVPDASKHPVPDTIIQFRLMTKMAALLHAKSFEKKIDFTKPTRTQLLQLFTISQETDDAQLIPIINACKQMLQ